MYRVLYKDTDPKQLMMWRPELANIYFLACKQKPDKSPSSKKKWDPYGKNELNQVVDDLYVISLPETAFYPYWILTYVFTLLTWRFPIDFESLQFVVEITGFLSSWASGSTKQFKKLSWLLMSWAEKLRLQQQRTSFSILTPIYIFTDWPKLHEFWHLSAG